VCEIFSTFPAVQCIKQRVCVRLVWSKFVSKLRPTESATTSLASALVIGPATTRWISCKECHWTVYHGPFVAVTTSSCSFVIRVKKSTANAATDNSLAIINCREARSWTGGVGGLQDDDNFEDHVNRPSCDAVRSVLVCTGRRLCVHDAVIFLRVHAQAQTDCSI